MKTLFLIAASVVVLGIAWSVAPDLYRYAKINSM
jgi:hypothetical protein